MFAWGEGTILRLLRDPEMHRLNQWQAAAMEAARRRGVRVPAVREVTTVMGRPGLVMERIEGADLLTLIGRRPWLVFRAARIAGEVHAQMHEVVAPSALPPLKVVLRQRIEGSGELAPQLREFALRSLDRLPDGDGLCHGDFHPGNIMMAGEEPVVIDWTSATRGDADADVARRHLMHRMGSLPPGASALLRLQAMVGRRLMLWLHLRSYRRARLLDMGAVSQWEIPVAAARLADGIESEVPALLAFLERARRGWSR